ncbi:DUF4142 domain-containing protein [Streptomyces sp. ISL-11]|uniref:DUF4142 domain-containing protein n=1 Tax=Streptomyces sp. ISL-11 TaxID=2819174 RepID=UPI001BE7439E|nr:DUF4142 domain-containing protein [Streptomyces sp. ISL-11]MBT2386394.1 DUF4142 domain-containing protein [Streptomyces sp. ISL-11]
MRPVRPSQVLRARGTRAHSVRSWARWTRGGRSAGGRVLGTCLVVGALAATLVALLLPVSLFGGTRPAAAGTPAFSDDGEGVRNTASGPLTPLDRDFVRKVRLAGLWEKPAGRLAQERGTVESVRIAGEHLVGGHSELDRRSLDAGRDLGITMPDRPNAQQQGWLDRMDAARGTEFDRTFAELVRTAHGKVFGLVALVRDRTGNSVVRELATRANAVVLDHITVLENTGLSGVPRTSPQPPAQAPAPPESPMRHGYDEMK